MESMDAFTHYQTKEKDMVVQMGDLKTSKDHVLVAYGRKNSKSKGKKKMKKKNPR